jgi:hypothetical protein
LKMAVAAQRMLKKSLTPASYERFRALCEENELGTDVVFQVIALLVGAASGKARAKLSGSSDGQSATSTSSSSDLQAYTEQGLRLVPAEDWAKVHLAS